MRSSGAINPPRRTDRPPKEGLTAPAGNHTDDQSASEVPSAVLARAPGPSANTGASGTELPALLTVSPLSWVLRIKPIIPWRSGWRGSGEMELDAARRAVRHTEQHSPRPKARLRGTCPPHRTSKPRVDHNDHKYLANACAHGLT